MSYRKWDTFRFGSLAAFAKAGMVATAAHRANQSDLEAFQGNGKAGSVSGTVTSFIGLPAPRTTEGDEWTCLSVLQYLLAGWPEGMERMRKALGHIKLPLLTSVKRRTVRGAEGDELDVDRYIAGSYDNMWLTRKRAACGAPPKVQVIVNAAMLGGVSTNSAFWRGAAGTAVAEALGAAGYQVKVDAIFNSRNWDEASTRGYSALVTVKDYDAPMNVSALLASTAHAASMRFLCFAHRRAACPVEGRSGFGTTETVDEDTCRERGWIDPGTKVLVVPANCLTERAAADWVKAVVADMEATATGHAA